MCGEFVRDVRPLTLNSPLPVSLPTGHTHLRYWMRASIHIQTFVYVVQGEPETPIKVGIARDPRKRLRALQTGNPQTLHLLYVVPGDSKLEANFHRRLKASAIHGEWFGGEEAEAFIAWFADYADRAIETFEHSHRILTAPPLPKVRQTPGLQAGAWSGKAKRWRTSDGKAHPITVKFVKPEPREIPDEIGEKLKQAAQIGFDGFELRALEIELRQRALAEAA